MNINRFDYIHKMKENEWIYYAPNINNVYQIFNFDDGNQLYKQYVNEWLMNGEWKGKVSLVNVKYSSIIINSISRWKILHI